MDLSQAHTVLEEEAGARKGLSTSRLESERVRAAGARSSTRNAKSCLVQKRKIEKKNQMTTAGVEPAIS
jgi:hypothetical protein